MGNGIYTHIDGNKLNNRKSNLKSIKNNNGKVIINGYVAIYMPEHKKALSNGCVYEHILVAEEILNRNLLSEECVHHIDRNRKNNNKDNLMIFATKSDHVSFHNGGEPIKLYDGTYICKRKVNENKICPICKHNCKDPSAKMCIQCYKLLNKKYKPSHEELKEKLNQYNYTEIGKIYDVSRTTIKRWMIQYNLSK